MGIFDKKQASLVNDVKEESLPLVNDLPHSETQYVEEKQHKKPQSNEPKELGDINASLEEVDDVIRKENHAFPEKVGEKAADKVVKNQAKKRRFQELPQIEQQIIFSMLRNRVQFPETIMQSIDAKIEDENSLTSFKRRLSKLNKDGYLKYSSSSKFKYVRATPKGVKAASTVLSGWMDKEGQQEKITFKDSSDHYHISALCAKTDVALLKQKSPETPHYSGYFTHCHLYGNDSEPVPKIQLENSTVINTDAIFIFKTEKEVVLQAMYFLRNLPIAFLYDEIDRELKEKLSKLVSVGISEGTKEKLKKISGFTVNKIGALLVTLESSRRDDIIKSLSSESESLKSVYVSHLEQLTGSPGFWNDAWYNLASPKAPGKLQEFWDQA